MTATRPRTLSEIVEVAETAFNRRSARQNEILQRIQRHAERLSSGRFQLAVLGQFKRGKSTLLNAMIGQPLLATGILPLTAIPTFLAAGEQQAIILTYEDGRREQKEMTDWRDLSQEIAAATTEEHNPGNIRGLARVDVTLSSRRSLETMVLIDTPGVGSTYCHNTTAAEAVLPECDAALFVVSPDPPITEVELKYLSEVCQVVSHVIVVLNKVDLVEAEDHDRALSSLRTVLSETSLRQIDPNIFAVSAKAALNARLRGKSREFAHSGLDGLENYIRQRLMRHKAELLEAAALRNIRLGIAELRNDVDMNRCALTLPLETLDENITIFEHAVEAFETERQSLDDLLNGEWRRSLALLDEIVRDGEQRLETSLDGKLDAILRSEASEEALRSALDSAMSDLFDKELGVVTERIGSRIEKTVAEHEQRYLSLVQRVHEAAAMALQTDESFALAEGHFTPVKQPYWTTRGASESLGSVTRDWIALLLPRRIRERRRLKMLRRSAIAAVGKNVANLHWAMRQNIDDNFRRLLTSCRQAVEESVEKTREILISARSRRQAEDASVRSDVKRLRRICHQLKEIERELTRY